MKKLRMEPQTFLNKKRINSFFSGIGGFEIAFQKNGFEPVFYCENNDFCRSVLKRHWPNVSNVDDIQKLEAADIPLADVWTAGFPCQDLSLARTPHGKRNGLKGAQSGLFYTFLDLVAERKPLVVLLENVVGLLNSHDGADFLSLVASLTKLGYAVAWRVLNARYFGVPQSRPRVFICAWYGSVINATRALYEDEIATKQKKERLGFIVESKCPESGISVPQVSFCISATSGRHTGLDWARSYVTYPDAVRRLTPLECERLQGFPDKWTLPDTDYVVPIRGIETNRYHAIGNAVCVPVVQWVAGRISDILQTSHSKEENAMNTAIKKQLQHVAETFLSSKCEVQALPVVSADSKWKSGGIAHKGWFVTAAFSSSPVAAVHSRLIDVIEKEAHARYFLSANAALGILRRVDNLGRHLFPPLDSVLREIAASIPMRDDDALEALDSTPGRKSMVL